MPETEAEKHIRIYDTEKEGRAVLDQYFQDLMYYSLPRKAYITRIKSVGNRIPTDIYDSTAILSNAYFAAGMQAYMSSPQTRWMTIAIKNRNYMTSQAVLKYLRDTEDVLYAMINSSNFYQEDVEGYLTLGSIGTDILYGEDDPTDDIRLHDMNIENVIIMEDSARRVKTAYIEYEFDASQAVEKFGKDKLSDKVLESFIKIDFKKKFKFLFCVLPRAVYDQSKKTSKNMPYAAIWIERDEKKIVREGGFREFPFFVSRFAVAKNSPYGYSPMMNVLPDVQMLNQIEYTTAIGAQLEIAPPVEIPDEAFLRPYNFNPRGRNIRNVGFPNEHITPINMGARTQIGVDYLEYKKTTIQQTFYNDLFLSSPQVGNRTATEVSIANNQRMQMLGSAVGNIMREKLSPFIERVYAIAAKNNKLPPLPPELIGQEYVIEYVSPLARAQKHLELQNLGDAMAVIGQFAELQLASGQFPEVLDKLNLDEATDYVAEMTNIAPKVIRDDAEVEEMRDGRAQQQEAQAQIQMIGEGAEAAKTGAETDKTLAEAGNVQ